jgi:sporulation protein YlmC with PRC-barrel domain
MEDSMNINRYTLTLTSAALMCGTAFAQDRASTEPKAAAPSTVQQEVAKHLAPGDKRASSLIGATVKNKNGESIGEVEDLIVSGRNNVAAAVITVGGLLGIGEKRIGLPYRDIEISPDGRTLYISMTEEQLDALPAFDYTEPDTVASRSTTSDSTARAPTATAARTEPPAAAPSGQASADNRTPASTSASSTANRAADATASSERTLKSGEQNARALIGAQVVDSSNEKVGRIRDLIVAPNGVQAVLMVGGAGIVNGHMVVVPLSSLKIQPAEVAGDEPDRVQTQMTASQIEALPAFSYN